MPAWLSITLLLGGTALAIRAVIAVRRLAHAGRQRSHERRIEREQKRAVKKRMGGYGTAGPSREPAVKPVDVPTARTAVAPLNLHAPRGDSQ